MSQQLVLPFQLNSEATLDDYIWGDNTLLAQQLKLSLQFQGERLIYLWGPSGCGKSHLLQAACQAVNAPHHHTMYLPLETLKAWDIAVLEGIEQKSLIAIDDIDAIANNITWEEALFHLYNRIRDTHAGLLIITGNMPPSALPLRLPDLKSRLAHGLVLQIHSLNDEDKIATLKLLAKKRGFLLSTQTGHFLLSRVSRNMHDLINILNQLDKASLAAKRKITIPFIKYALNI